jgi:hypothetical protein
MKLNSVKEFWKDPQFCGKYFNSTKNRNRKRRIIVSNELECAFDCDFEKLSKKMDVRNKIIIKLHKTKIILVGYSLRTSEQYAAYLDGRIIC